MHGLTGQVNFIYANPAFSAGNQADNHVETRCFSGAIRPQQADNLATVNGYRDIVNNTS
jgi:hypothetical protein